jgi:hypothetical protein
MRKTIWLLLTLVILLVFAVVLSRAQAPAGRGAQAQGQTQPVGRGAAQPPVAVFKLEDHFLQWRLLPSEKQYEAIDRTEDRSTPSTTSPHALQAPHAPKHLMHPSTLSTPSTFI